MDNCIICGKDKSFLGGTNELCLSCFDALQVQGAPALARLIGELAFKHVDLKKDTEQAVIEIVKLTQ